MAHTTYQITLALDGRHTVSATTDDPAETKTALAWTKATYEALVSRYGSKAAPVDTTEPAEEEAPMCEVHQLPMHRMQGKKGPFWSCHERDESGNFCSYRPGNGV